jgi:hypothetical protein
VNKKAWSRLVDNANAYKQGRVILCTTSIQNFKTIPNASQVLSMLGQQNRVQKRDLYETSMSTQHSQNKVDMLTKLCCSNSTYGCCTQ